MTASGVEAVIESVRAGDVDGAVSHARQVDFEELHQALLGEAFDEQSLACYGVYLGLLFDQESAARHVSASEVLSLALNVYRGAYPLAFFHARRAVALAPDEPSYKEHLLSFHNNPEHLLSRQEAQRVASELLERDPANRAAHEVLRQLGDG